MRHRSTFGLLAIAAFALAATWHAGAGEQVASLEVPSAEALARTTTTLGTEPTAEASVTTTTVETSTTSTTAPITSARLPETDALALEKVLLEKQVFVERLNRIQIESAAYQGEVARHDQAAKELLDRAIRAAGMDPEQTSVDITTRMLTRKAQP